MITHPIPPETELRDFISMAVCGLCDKPSTVKVSAVNIEDKNYFITIYCHMEDRKRVVGKEGRNIEALRTLAQSIAAKHRVRSTVVVDE